MASANEYSSVWKERNYLRCVGDRSMKKFSSQIVEVVTIGDSCFPSEVALIEKPLGLFQLRKLSPPT